MSAKHLTWAILTVCIWGSNFVVVRLALGEFPPIFLGVLRFTLAAFPLILFYRLPKIYWSAVATYSALQFVTQFACMYSAMALGMPAGLTSLIVQSQALFTVLIAALYLREPVRFLQMCGLGVAVVGIVFAGWHVSQTGGAEQIPVIAFALAVLGALGWGAGNVQLRRMSTQLNLPALPPMALMSWAAALAVPPLLVLSLWLEGAPAILHALQHATMIGWSAAFYQAYANTILGYGIWSWLIGRYGAVHIAPFSLMVPIVGMSTAQLFLGEQLNTWKTITFVLVMSGLVLNQYGHFKRNTNVKATHLSN